jgi:RNA polymerase sigma-70 factor (ECF subfamily)
MSGELRAAPDERMGIRPGNGLTLSDRELTRRLRAADADAAETLVNTYGARAHRLAVRITGSEADAEEVVQDALWTVVRKVEAFKGDAALGTWIYRITANAAYNQLRRRGRRQREVSWDDLPPDLQPASGDDPARQTELRTVLTAAIDELGAVDRTVVVLHDVDGMSHLDIAATLNLSVPAVKARVRRVHLLLRRRLHDYLEDVSKGTQPDRGPLDPAGRGDRGNDGLFGTLRLLRGQPELLQLRIEPHPGEPERGRRRRLVALGLREGIRDRTSFELLKGRRRILSRDA